MGREEVMEVNMHGRPSLHNTILPVVPYVRDNKLIQQIHL